MIKDELLASQGRLLTAAAIALLALAAALGVQHGAPSGTPSPLPAQGDATRGESSWMSHLHRVEAALAQKNTTAAEMAWQRAYREALRSRQWEPLLELGNAALRIGGGGAPRAVATQMARQAYLDALFCARDRRSVDGVLRAAEAFAALGDRDVVVQSLRIADVLADAEGPAARERVAAARRRLAPTNPKTE